MNNDFKNKYRVESKNNNQKRFTSKDDVRAMSKQERVKRVRKIRLRLATVSLSLGILLGAARISWSSKL